MRDVSRSEEVVVVVVLVYGSWVCCVCEGGRMGGLMMIVSGDDEDVATAYSEENKNARAEGEQRVCRAIDVFTSV